MSDLSLSQSFSLYFINTFTKESKELDNKLLQIHSQKNKKEFDNYLIIIYKFILSLATHAIFPAI